MICSWTFHVSKRKRQSWMSHCSVFRFLLLACLPFSVEICFWGYFTIMSLCFSSSSHSDSGVLQWPVTLRNTFYLRISNRTCVVSCLLCNSGKIADYTCIRGLNTFIHWNMKDSVLSWQHYFKKKIRTKEICTLYIKTAQNTLLTVDSVLLRWWHVQKIRDK